MEKTLENPELTQQIKLSMASLTRIYVAAKTLFLPLLSIVTPTLIVFLADNQKIKTLSLISGVIVFLLLILFYYFSPHIVGKRFQFEKFIFDLYDQMDAWQRKIHSHKQKRDNFLNRDALTISPYPEITKSLQKTFSESVKLMQNVDSNYEISLRTIIENYNQLSVQYAAVGQECSLYEPLKIVTETLQKSKNERFSAATTFFEACKAEQKNLPNSASTYKIGLVARQQEEIAECEAEINRLQSIKAHAYLMFKSV
ncbi:MAG: hypothetical protein ACOYL8_02850 [Patescibacteria group bacterium]